MSNRSRWANKFRRLKSAVFAPESRRCSTPDGHKRGELQNTGALGADDRTVPVSVEREINRRNAGSYEVGDCIEFRAGSPERGIQPNSSATVLAVNNERNQLTLQRQDGS